MTSKRLAIRLSVGILSIFISLSATFAYGAPRSVRWIGAENSNADFAHVVDTLNTKTGLHLDLSDFLLYEDRELATSRFRMYLQIAGDVPIKSMSIRVWSELKSGKAIQVEAQVEGEGLLRLLRARIDRFSEAHDLSDKDLQTKLLKIVRVAVASHPEDSAFRLVTAKDYWVKNRLVREFRVTARRGYHFIQVSIDGAKIVSQSYRPFAQADQNDEFALPARVFPIWEETPTGSIQSRVLTRLKHLKRKVARVTIDPFASLRSRRYFTDMHDNVLGQTTEGQAQGYWSLIDLGRRAQQIRSTLPTTANDFANGILLEGRYATVSFHPDVAKKFNGLKFQPGISTQMRASWIQLADGRNEIIPQAGLLGRPLTSYEDAFNRPARRLTDHNPVAYINDGFDEIQVYWSIDTLFDTLHAMGFNDPELSTRPFHAFLFDPEIGFRDNAYYMEDTINFTTYSPRSQNYARDNSTIWHELGHGVMDRMMGDLITLNDTGGLSEGMADFIAALVISRVTRLQTFTGDQEFRIINNTAFNLTNESHDDGEAYGGAMFDFLKAAIQKYGLDGVTKATDVTLEAMRLTRNHPALTAQDWFGHMLYADELGHEPTRKAGELRELMMKALNNRNFSFDGKGLAEFKIFNGSEEVITDGPGTRAKPVVVNLRENEKAAFSVKVTATTGANNVLAFPLKVVVGYRGGPLQGSVHWEGEENGDVTHVLKTPEDEAKFTLTATGKCDEINRDDGGCSDFVYIQLVPPNAKKAVAKKRFYVRVKPPAGEI